MKKTQLEQKITDLEQKVSNLEKRISLLESQKQTINVYPYQTQPQYPNGTCPPSTNYPVVTC